MATPLKFELVERLPQESTREYVCRLLRTNIINLNLPPGTNLSEQEIADFLNVSRTPVREAFIKLNQDNVVDILPQKGTYVSLIDPEHVAEAKFLRECVEKEVIKHACVSFPKEESFKLQSNLALQELCIAERNYVRWFELDEEMHGTIFAGCKKAHIWSVIQQMNIHYNRVRMLNLAFGYDWPLLVEQHKEIFRAIRESDTSLGSKVIHQHLNKVTVDLQLLQKDFGHYFKQVKQFPFQNGQSQLLAP